MAEDHSPHGGEDVVTERGLLDAFKKKEDGEHHHDHQDHPHHHGETEEVLVAEFSQVNVTAVEEKKEKEGQHHGLLEKLHRSDSSSSSSSEEEGDSEEKKKKKKEKKSLKEKVKEKICGDEEKPKVECHEAVVVEAEKEVVQIIEVEEHPREEGFPREDQREAPGSGHSTAAPPPPVVEAVPVDPVTYHHPEGHCHEGEGVPKEKKGILEKIKEKLPGYHPKGGEESENH